ncbi:hypothetical protein SAMN04487934_11362 [Eubacterium ruminantium]|nr:hypothetical protein SAMN04487934_11362 [Eubacterium ruminantium]
MPAFKELELRLKFDRIYKLSRYLERNMKGFHDTFALYNSHYTELKNKLDELYRMNEYEIIRKMNAADVEELKNKYRSCVEMVQHQKEQMHVWAEANGISQNVITKADRYFTEINELFTKDKVIIDTLDINDDLSLPAAVYKNSYELAHNMPKKDVSFEEYRKIMGTTNTTEDALIEKYMKSDSEKIRRDCIARMEKHPSIYEYTSMPNDAIYAVNTGDEAIINEYLTTHAGELTLSQEMKLKKQIEAGKLADKMQSYAEFFMEAGDEIGEKPKVFRPSDAKEPDACELDIALPEFQTSSQGCWSCAAQLLINSRGNKEITQANVRDYRAKLTKAEIDEDKRLIHQQYNYDSGKNFMNMSDPVLAYAPNSMVHELTIQQYLRPEEKKGISAERYLDNTLEVLRKNIKHAINVDHSPIAFNNQGHYITIIGIDGDTIKYKESQKKGDATPNQTHTASLKKLVANLIVNKDVSKRKAVEISWVSDIKLSKDGRTIHGIPSKYTKMNDDGSLQLPPNDIQIFSDEANRTGINKKGVRLYRPGGDEDNFLKNNEESVYSDGGIVKMEKVYMPKQLNAEYLKKMAEKRSEEDEASLDIMDREFWGVDNTIEIERPDLENNLNDNIINNNIENVPNNIQNDVPNNVQNNGANNAQNNGANNAQNNAQNNGVNNAKNNPPAGDVPVEPEADEEYYPHFSLSEISAASEKLADEIDEHRIVGFVSQYQEYNNLSTQLQEIKNLADLGWRSAQKNDGTFGQNETKRLLELINAAIATANDYLSGKSTDLKDNPLQKIDPDKLKREQPRIIAMLKAFDKLTDIRNSLVGGNDMAIKKAEKENTIRNFRADLINTGVDRKKQQDDSFKNREPNVEYAAKQIDEIDALMGIQPVFLDSFKDKHRIPYENKGDKKVSMFFRIKSFNDGFKAIGSDDEAARLSNKDFAALSFAASTTRKVYEKLDKIVLPLDDYKYHDKETRYILNCNRLPYSLASELDYGLSFYIDHISDARDYAKEALQSYENGNKEPLAALITEGIKNFNRIALNGQYEWMGNVGVYSEMGQRMTAMLDRDPELFKMAVGKGLTGDEISHIRSLGTVGKCIKLYTDVDDLLETANNTKRKLNWSDAQKLEYYTDFLMGIRFRENIEAINAEIESKPEYIRDIAERDKKAEQISRNAIADFDTAIEKVLEDNYGAADYVKMLDEYKAKKAQALLQPTEELKFDSLVNANSDFRDALRDFVAQETAKIQDYENRLVEEMLEAAKEFAKRDNVDITAPENNSKRVKYAIKAKNKQLELRKNLYEKGGISDAEINRFAVEYEDFKIFERRANALNEIKLLSNEVKLNLPGGGTMQYYLDNSKGYIKDKYRDKDNLLQMMANPGKYEAERRRVKEYLKGSGVLYLSPKDFYNKMYRRAPYNGQTFLNETARYETVAGCISEYEKLKPQQKQQLRALYEPLAEVRDPNAVLQDNGRVAGKTDKKELRNRIMINAFVKKAEACIKNIKSTYGKGKSDSKPSELMMAVVRGLKGFSSDMSVEEFNKKLQSLQESVDKYIDKRGLPSKADRVDRREFLMGIRTDIVQYKQEALDISNGKAGRVHEVIIGDKTRGREICVNDLKKNLIAFTYQMMNMRGNGIQDLVNYDPSIPAEHRMMADVVPPEPSPAFRKVMDCMKDWNRLGMPDTNGNAPKVSFDKLKEIVQNLNTASTIWLSTNKPGKTNFTANRYDLVKNVWINAQNALKNIRFIEPYMDIVTPEGRMGSLDVYDALKSMPDPYNKIKVITSEEGQLSYSPEVYDTWKNAYGVLKADKNNFQRAYSKGLELRSDISTACAADFSSPVNNTPVSKLPNKLKTPDRLKRRDERLALHAATALFVKQMDEIDGWKDIIGYHKNDIYNALTVIAKSMIKTQAYKNVTRESDVQAIGESVMKEAKRLGTDKELLNIASLSNVEKVIRKMKKEAKKVNIKAK